MSEHDALTALGERLGVAPGYHDIWGGWHPVTAATLRALLTGMGLDLAGTIAAARTAATTAADEWRRGLPAVLVARAGEAPRVPLVLPAAVAREGIAWCLEEEGGGILTGEVTREAMTGMVADAEQAVDDGTPLARVMLALPPVAATGYHNLHVDPAGGQRTSMRLIVAPDRCHLPEARSRDGRVWGMTLQLYGLRSRRNWGIGDFGDLARAVEVLAGLGADLVGLSPLHTLYPARPEDASPYSPSTRAFLNVLYLDVPAVPDFAESEAASAWVARPTFHARLDRVRAAALVDYATVAALKLEALWFAYEGFRRRHLDPASARGRAFRGFQARGGEALRSLALFEAMSAHGAMVPANGPRSAAVAAFREAHGVRVEFYEYLQWQGAEQLDGVAARASALGMHIGLYVDLAVGADRRGAEVWGQPGSFAGGVSVGAPPDDFSLSGQSWGLPPWRPGALRDDAYEPFVRTLRANMRAAGALRVDHVVGLMRLFWVPDGLPATDGAYVGYPLDDLLGILALESERHRCTIIGEDLGTVPDEVRAALRERGVLSYRVLYFEKHWHGDRSFKRPHELPADALVTVSTHDLPTFAGYWSGEDIALRARLGLLPSEDVRIDLVRGRAHDREGLLAVLGEQGLHPGDVDPGDGKPASPALQVAVQRYLARSPARVMVVQMEDALGLPDQANLPGTIAEQPNWRRRLPLAVEDWAIDPRLLMLAGALNGERGAGVPGV